MTQLATQITTGQPGAGPSIYYLHPLLAGPVAGWGAHFSRIADLGFSHVLTAPPFAPAPHGSLMLSATHDVLHPALEWAGGAEAGLAEIAQMAAAAGLKLLLDVVLNRVADGSALALAAGSPFSEPDQTLDPYRFDPDGDAAHAPMERDVDVARLAEFWVGRLAGWARGGVAGFRLTGLRDVPAGVVRAIADGISREAQLFGDMAGVSEAGRAAFVGVGLDYVFSSLPWWDGRADWYFREDAALRRIAPVIGAAEVPFAPRLAEHAHDAGERLGLLQRGLNLSATLGSGWMVVMGAEYAALHRLDARRDQPEDFALLEQSATAGLVAEIKALNELRAATPALSANGETRLLGGLGGNVLAFARAATPDVRLPGDVAVVAVNMVPQAPAAFDAAGLYANLGGYYPVPAQSPPAALAPGEVFVETLTWQSFAGPGRSDLAYSASVTAASAARIAIEAVSPTVDNGRFPARFCLGETVTVQADIICDGHDVLAAAVRWRAPTDAPNTWRRAPMRPLGNDRWEGTFSLPALGLHHFTVEAWKDVFGTYRDELSKKFAAGLDVTLEVEEGRLLVASNAGNAGAHRAALNAISAALAHGTVDENVVRLLADETAVLMRAIDARAFATWIDPVFPVEAERTAARFASWYEVFPRSMSDDENRHGTFADVLTHLPRIQAMGFDVLYFPPIHPIGKKNRKGRNNTLDAGENDPGSPYGIADHTGIHEELGSFADFARLRDAALAHGLEIALDFAIQCSPDHPWLAAHKGWFDWRPDGSIRYAENPPKKYQDIVNVDFYKPQAMDGLWLELCNVVLFWCDQGVRIFRVDNPHTKPLPFWHWMITEVRARFPDAIFLAEAFTKPKMMNRLAKVGFSQSYTYFTWRNTKSDLQDYMVELSTGPAKDFFRPNFFVNTPDINPVFLQESGRAGHLIRAALAATLAGLWGVYSGFDLCDATPLPGREEYQDSEKYQFRAWDWDRPGNIVREITQLNAIRRLNPALQTHLGVTFLSAPNDRVLVFEKATADRSNVVLVAINLDPFGIQETTYEVPLWLWQLPDWASVEADDLVFDTRYRWAGKIQHVRLNPNENPYAIWRVRPV